MHSIKPHFFQYLFLLLFFFIAGCSDHNNAEGENSLFTLLATEGTGVDFENTLTEGLITNIMM
jgi:hypothetical protein